MHDESEVFVEIRLTCSEQLQTFFPQLLKVRPYRKSILAETTR